MKPINIKALTLSVILLPSISAISFGVASGNTASISYNYGVDVALGDTCYEILHDTGLYPLSASKLKQRARIAIMLYTKDHNSDEKLFFKGIKWANDFWKESRYNAGLKQDGINFCIALANDEINIQGE